MHKSTQYTQKHEKKLKKNGKHMIIDNQQKLLIFQVVRKRLTIDD